MALAIVLVLLGAVGLSVGSAARAGARAEAERARALVELARDAALLEARPLRLVAGANGYRFEAMGAGGWRPVAEGRLRPRRLPAGTRAALVAAGGAGAVVLDETGLYTPFTWRFRDGTQGPAWVVRGDGVGAPVLVPPEGGSAR